MDPIIYKPAALPTTAQSIWYDSTEDRAGYSDGTNKFYFSRCNQAGTTYKRLRCDMNVATLGTPATDSSTETVLGAAWELNAVAEQLNLVARERIPAGFTAGHDAKLQVHCLLADGETNGDDIDMDGEWRTIAVGDGPAKTAEAFAAAVQVDIGTDITQYDYHVVEIPIDHDAVGNVIASGDLFMATINLATITGVAGVLVVGADLLLPMNNMED